MAQNKKTANDLNHWLAISQMQLFSLNQYTSPVT
jgi:hypothetical protein